jgi:hypothetical protein
MNITTYEPKQRLRFLNRVLWPLKKLRLRSRPQMDLQRATASHRAGSLFSATYKASYKKWNG